MIVHNQVRSSQCIVPGVSRIVAREAHTMSPDSRKTSYRIEAATEDDWPWIAQGQVETIWVRLGPKRQRGISRRTIEEYVERQIAAHFSLRRCAQHNRPEALQVLGLSSGNAAHDQKAKPGRACRLPPCQRLISRTPTIDDAVILRLNDA